VVLNTTELEGEGLLPLGSLACTILGLGLGSGTTDSDLGVRILLAKGLYVDVKLCLVDSDFEDALKFTGAYIAGGYVSE